MTQEIPVSSVPSVPREKPSPVLIVLLIMPMLGIVVALVMIIASPRAQNTLPGNLDAASASVLNFTAPAFDVLDPDGTMFSLLDYPGRIVFLNFWQTTCIPCREEMPALAQFSREQGADGAVVIAINFDETTEAVKQFLAQYEVIGLKVGMDFESRIQRAYGVSAIPTTFVLNEEGVVVYMKLGEITIDDMYGYLEALKAPQA